MWLAVVLLAGAVVGAAGFWLEQSRAEWPPVVERTKDGWRAATPRGMRPWAVAISGDVLVWNEGAYTVLLDLRGGDTKLLGAAGRAYQLQRPCVSGTTVMWSLSSVMSGVPSAIWRYDTRSRRRVRLEDVGNVDTPPAVSEPRAAWVEKRRGSDQQTLVLADLETGSRSDVTTASSFSSVTMSGDLLAWVRSRPGEPPVIEVLEVTSGRTWQIAPYAYTDQMLLGIALAAHTLVWARTGGTEGGQVMAFDLDDGTSRQLVSADAVRSVAADGDVVVWYQASGDGAGSIQALHLDSGATQPVATVSGIVPQIAVSGDTVAWAVQSLGSFTGVQTARIGATGGVQASADVSSPEGLR